LKEYKSFFKLVPLIKKSKIMKSLKPLFLSALLVTSSFLEAKNAVSIVPAPASMTLQKGHFILSPKSTIVTNCNDENIENIISQFNSHISDFYKMPPMSRNMGNMAVKGSVCFKIEENSTASPEGYRLTVTKDFIEICASNYAGIFYGMQSLFQMMPPEKRKISRIKIPCVEINDFPRFSWRGLHLDVCRHFMPKEFIFKYLDYMAIHKLNTFHFHLTDDQGWRIEIKKYPLLTEIGSTRSETLIGRYSKDNNNYDGIPHSGYFTQDDIREIVKYAADRYITVVPEIEMPGHALAALSAYPFLGCTGGPYKTATTWGIFDDVMCAGKDSTFKFLEGVLEEVIELFPSSYIHIGGDECPKTKWQKCPLCQQRIKEEGLLNEHQLQSYFTQRIEKYINSKGRKIIGWDEILEGGLAPNAAVMSWRGEEGGIAAANQQHYVVMAPTSCCYLDYYQGDRATEPIAIGGYVSLKKVYDFEPVPTSIKPENTKFILGGQGNVWTEYIATPEHVEYMAYPRAAALSEVLWSPKESRDYTSFMNRMKIMIKRYDAIGLNYCHNEFIKPVK
jgi:hexosaminidase